MTEEVKKTEKIKIPEVLTVGEFAELLSIPVSSVIGELMKNGVMATINENIDYEPETFEYIFNLCQKDIRQSINILELTY